MGSFLLEARHRQAPGRAQVRQGKLGRAHRYGDGTSRVDRGDESRARRQERAGLASLVGGKNWHPMSYSPVSQLLYMNTMAFGWDYQPLPREVANLKPGQPHYGVKRPLVFLYDDPNGRGYLRASSPSPASQWAVPTQSPNFSGTLVTAGGLLCSPAGSPASSWRSMLIPGRYSEIPDVGWHRRATNAAGNGMASNT